MANILLSGPAGASKSAVARQIIEDDPGLVLQADFTALNVAISGAVRDPSTGRYPERDGRLNPTTEYLRRTLVRSAVERGIRVVATNSDGDPTRRAFLLEQLGEGAEERIIDPGRDVVRARLSDEITGELGSSCENAIERWYSRL